MLVGKMWLLYKPVLSLTHTHTHTHVHVWLNPLQTTSSHACGDGIEGERGREGSGSGGGVARFSCISDLCEYACVFVCMCVCEKIIKQGRQMSPVRRLEVTWDQPACPTFHTNTHTHTHTHTRARTHARTHRHSHSHTCSDSRHI